MMVRVLVLVLVWCTGVVLGQISECTRSDILTLQGCFAAVGTDIEQEPETQEQLEQHCIVVRETEECAGAIMDRCMTTSMELLQVEGALDALMYICDNSEFYLEHNDCITSNDPESIRNGCMHDEQYAPDLPSVRQLCDQILGQFECVRDATLPLCGAEAAEFQYQLTYRMVHRTLEYAGCNVTLPTPTTPTPPTAPPYVTGAPGDVCNYDVINQCLENSQRFLRNAGQVHMERSLFEEGCSFLEESSECARSWLAACSKEDVVAATHRGVLQAYTYLCDVKAHYLEHQTCLTDPNLQYDMNYCMYPLEHYEQQGDANKTCNQWQHDLDCVRAHVNHRCAEPEAPGAVMYQFWYIKIKPRMDALNCEWSTQAVTTSPAPVDPQAVKQTTVEDDDKDMIIGLSAGAAGLVVLIAVIVVVVVVFKGRRGGAASRQQHERVVVVATNNNSNNALENPMYGVADGNENIITLNMDAPAYETSAASGAHPKTESSTDYEQLPPKTQ